MIDLMQGNIMDSDSYKGSHFNQSAMDTTGLFMYMAARGTDTKVTEFVPFGAQYVLKRYISQPITMEEIDEAESYFMPHMGIFNRKGWEHILKFYNGYLPLTIRMVPEGTPIPVGHAWMTVECTDPHCFWLASYVETMLERIWYGSTVASNSRYARHMIQLGLERSSMTPEEQIHFKLHDFGSRGASSRETAAIGGAAHLLNFMGTDTTIALKLVRQYYGVLDNPLYMPGFSIPAMEHSTITSWGRAGESRGYANFLKHYGHFSAIAAVSDSYDIDHAIKKIWGEELRDQVLACKAVVILRPDSGKDPAEETVRCLNNLLPNYKFTENQKGFKVFDKVRIIYGDSITLDSIPRVLGKTIEAGFSIDNIAMGMGAGLLQKVNRDDFKVAYKCSARSSGMEWIDVFKDPKGDPVKRSQGGRLTLYRDIETKEYITRKIFIEEAGFPNYNLQDQMHLIYQNGRMPVNDDFPTLKARGWV